jgi:hypothetical protein
VTEPRTDRYYASAFDPLFWGCLICHAYYGRRGWHYTPDVIDTERHDQWHDTGNGRWVL